MSIWKYDFKSQKIILNDPDILYGHHDWIIRLSVNSTLQIVISADKKNHVLMHSLKNKKFIMEIELDINFHDNLYLIKIHENGLILFISEKNWIGLFKLNIFIN